tara:strand:- start:590 stop:1213 length:624 start_codon:yes stop_codon:yes gene_type:complete
MKKLLLLSALLIFAYSSAQKINKNGDGYSEVYQTDLTIKEVNQKVVEWVSENYKSAKDVIELNIESKIILKGNFLIDMKAAGLIVQYRISNTLSFYFREGRWKIDFIPTKISYDGTDVDSYLFKQFITNEVMSKDTYLEYSIEVAKNLYIKMGYSDKKSLKMVNKYVLPNADISYKNYIDNKKEWEYSINSTFKSIDDFVKRAKDDW